MVEEAHRLAVEAEDLHDEGHLQLAAARFEKAAEAYVRATLSTNDTASLQSLRLLALKHSQVHMRRDPLVHVQTSRVNPCALPSAHLTTKLPSSCSRSEPTS